MHPATINPEASEHQRGRDGLYACCDTLMQTVPEGLGLRWQKTSHPMTSPAFDTPAWDAWASGEEVWEPYFVLKRSVL